MPRLTPPSFPGLSGRAGEPLRRPSGRPRGESRRPPRSASPSARARQLTPQAVKDGPQIPDKPRKLGRAGGAAAVVGLIALAVGAAIALPAAQSGAQSVDELNARIASAQSQAESLGAEIDASASQLAAARSEAAAAAAREAELSAVLARGQEREAQLEVQSPGDRGAARQGSRPPAPRPRGALGPPRVDLQGRRARCDRAAARLERLRRPGQPRRAARPDRGAPTRRSPRGCAGCATWSRRSSPR